VVEAAPPGVHDRRAKRISKIVDLVWHDLMRRDRSSGSVKSFFANMPTWSSDDPAAQSRVREGRAPVKFLDYNWALNASP